MSKKERTKLDTQKLLPRVIIASISCIVVMIFAIISTLHNTALLIVPTQTLEIPNTGITRTKQATITPQKPHGSSTITPRPDFIPVTPNDITGTPFAITTDTLYPTSTLALTGTAYLTSTVIVETPNATETLMAAFNEVDTQFQNSLQANIAFNKPEQMNKDEVTSIELILNPSLSASALSTQLVERGDFLTSTSEPNVLIAPSGEMVKVETGQIEISPLMKAVLLPQDPEAFVINAMHNNPEQVISLNDTAIWRWSVTAKKEGSQTLELIIYQLVKYDGKDYWHEVETYKANIVVEVTIADRIKSWDWRWIAGFVITLIGAILAILKWLEDRRKMAEVNKPPAPPRRIK